MTTYLVKYAIKLSQTSFYPKSFKKTLQKKDCSASVVLSLKHPERHAEFISASH